MLNIYAKMQTFEQILKRDIYPFSINLNYLQFATIVFTNKPVGFLARRIKVQKKWTKWSFEAL